MIILIVSIIVFIVVGITIPTANEMINKLDSKYLRNILRICAISFIIGSIYMLPIISIKGAVMLLLTLSIISASILKISGFENQNPSDLSKS